MIFPGLENSGESHRVEIGSPLASAFVSNICHTSESVTLQKQ